MNLPTRSHACWQVLTLTAVAALCASSCMSEAAQMKAVHEGVVGTPGVAIWAPDSTFLLESGRPFQAPFVSEGGCVRGARAGDYMRAKELGARPVVVKIPGAEQPLYGLLALCRVPSLATGPSSRSFNIRVPDAKLAETEGGLVSLVHEYTNFEDYPLWQLWLARTPGVWR